MDNFYVTLISNNKSDSSNTSSSFRTYLPYTLQLTGEWECALVELSFMRSWNNIDNIRDERKYYRNDFNQTTIGYRLKPQPNEDYEGIDYLEFEKLAEFPNSNWRFFDIPGGHYTAIDDLLNNIQSGFEENIKQLYPETIEKREEIMQKIEDFLDVYDESDYREKEYMTTLRFKSDTLGEWLSPGGSSRMDEVLTNGFKIIYDQVKNRIVLKVNPDLIEDVMLSKHLEFVLGFGPKPGVEVFEFVNSSGTYIADHPVNLNSGANSLYVYTDIIQPNIVSDTMARLLRIVNAEGEYGIHFTKAYTKPYYIPVAYSSINKIEVEIKDEMNRLIRFSFGVTIAKLHFQKKKRFPL